MLNHCSACVRNIVQFCITQIEMCFLNFIFNITLIVLGISKILSSFVLNRVHSLLLHRVKLILNRLGFSDIKVTSLIERFNIFAQFCWILFIFFITLIVLIFVFIFSWRPIIQLLTLSSLINKLVISKLKMGLAHLLTTNFTNVISHGVNTVFLKIFLGHWLIIGLIVAVSELLHSIF